MLRNLFKQRITSIRPRSITRHHLSSIITQDKRHYAATLPNDHHQDSDHHSQNPVTLQPETTSTSHFVHSVLLLEPKKKSLKEQIAEIEIQEASIREACKKQLEPLQQQRMKLQNEMEIQLYEQRKQLAEKQTQFSKACRKGNTVLVKQLLDENFELPMDYVIYYEKKDPSFIHHFWGSSIDPVNATMHGDHVECLHLLLASKRALGNKQRVQSLLVEAILLDARRCAIYLINENINISKPYLYQSTYRETGPMGFLISKYDWVDKGSPVGLAIARVSEDRVSEDVALLLIQNNADLEYLYGDNEIYARTSCDDGGVGREYLKWDEVRDLTPLLVAVKKANSKNKDVAEAGVRIIKALLDRGVNIDHKDRHHKKALDLTTNPEVKELLLMKEKEMKLEQTYSSWKNLGIHSL
jgi:hypothetical protein